MVTVAYEQERGLREKHQNVIGYVVSVSGTYEVAIDVLYENWSDENCARNGSRKIVVRKATVDKLCGSRGLMAPTLTFISTKKAR